MPEPIDAAQAREHIEMVEHILAESSQRLSFGGEYFVVWGLYSGLATANIGLVSAGGLPATPALVAQAVVLVAAIAFSIWRGRSKAASEVRRSLVQREFFNVLWLTLSLAFVANVVMFNLFRGIGNAAIWGFAEAIVLFFIGMHGNRRAQIAGIAMLASMVAANFLHGTTALFVLAAGMVAGYAGFGLSELISRD